MPSRKTILFSNVGADLYGADYVLLCLVRSLDPKHFRSLVLVPYAGPLVKELEDAGAAVRVREFPVLRRSVFTPLGLARFAWQMVVSVVFLILLAKREKVDIFHTNTASIWPPGIAAAILRKKHIWQIMELVESPRGVAWAMARMTGIFSTRVFCISDAVRRHFLRDNWGREGKFETLYHGVNTDEYDPARCHRAAMRQQLKIPEGATVVLYAGRFSAWKGQDVFARAIRELIQRGVVERHEVHFVILGSCFPGQEVFEKNLDETLGQLNGDGRHIHRHGFQRNLPEWMAASDIFVLPSTRPEPNATVLLGAMSMGLACIGTRIGGTVETIVDGQTGILIEPSHVMALADAMSQLIADPLLRERMGRGGRLRARKFFSMERYCATLREAYGR